MAKHAHTTPERRPASARGAGGRRLLFGTAAALAFLPALRASAAPKPDAELIQVCAAFVEGCSLYRAIYDGPDAIEDDDAVRLAAAPIFAAWRLQLDRMEGLRASTAAGIQARAHALHAHAGHGAFSFDAPSTTAGRLLAYLMRDAAALGAPEPGEFGTTAWQPQPRPDAALIAACGAFCEAERAWSAQVSVAGRLQCGDPKQADEEAAADRLAIPRDCALEAVMATPCTALGGAQALAGALVEWEPELLTAGGRDPTKQLTAQLVRSLLAMQVPA